jgi:hypothetical protein
LVGKKQVVIAEGASPESSSYPVYILLVLLPLGINWFVLWLVRGGEKYYVKPAKRRDDLQR